MVIRTSKNLTIAGIAGMVLLVANALVALFDGDTATNVDWSATLNGLYIGIVALLAKGQASTGGTVNAAGDPV